MINIKKNNKERIKKRFQPVDTKGTKTNQMIEFRYRNGNKKTSLKNQKKNKYF